MRRRRRLHRKERQHRNNVIIVSLFTLVLFLSCGYAAFSTSINLTAKGTIKNTITIDELKKTVVSSNDGLYKDAYEDNRYIYKGTEPSNYISFNNEIWRIISIESDNTLKIIRNESIGENYWDINGSNNWEVASLNIYLNDTYYNSLADTSNIINHIWNVGVVGYSSDSSEDLSITINEEKSLKLSAFIGLINVSDYIKATINNNCKNIFDYGVNENCISVSSDN